MGYKRIKPEHGGAWNGGGAWMTRAEAKETAERRRRQVDKQDESEALVDEQSQAKPRQSLPIRSTDPDPQPGDFDSELNQARPDQIEIHDGHPLPATHERLQQAAEGARVAGEGGDLDQSSAPASRGVLHHMTDDEEEAGLSWEEFRPR